MFKMRYNTNVQRTIENLFGTVFNPCWTLDEKKTLTWTNSSNFKASNEGYRDMATGNIHLSKLYPIVEVN